MDGWAVACLAALGVVMTPVAAALALEARAARRAIARLRDQARRREEARYVTLVGGPLDGMVVATSCSRVQFPDFTNVRDGMIGRIDYRSPDEMVYVEPGEGPG